MIHAGWPVYAVDHGTDYSLVNLVQFPRGTKFTCLDDIDQCFLFISGDAPPPNAPDLKHRFYVALWHEDVLELIKLGYINGASVITYREWAVREAEKYANYFFQLPDGTLKPVPLPDPDVNEGFAEYRPVIDDKGLLLNESGFMALEALLFSEREQIAELLMHRCRHSIDAQLYDSAVREAGIVIVTAMRSVLGTKAFGAS